MKPLFTAGKYLFVPCTLAAAIAAHAQDESSVEEASAKEQSSIDSMEEIRVWGTQVIASSIKMDVESIALKQADHISDLLRGIPGVDVGGAHSLNQRISIRSMDDKDLRITIDGANQNTYMYHHMGNLQIHADILQSVEIKVGNNSVVDGGLGGTVRFKTKEAQDLLAKGQRFGGRVQGNYADNKSTGGAITGYGKLSESIDVLAYFNQINRGNYTVGGGQIKNAEGDEVAGTDGDVRGLKGELTNMLLKFGWDISDSQRFKVGYESYKDEGDYSYRPDMGLATDLAIAENLNLPLTFDTEFTRDTFTLNYDMSLGESEMNIAAFKNISRLRRDETAIYAGSDNPIHYVEGEATNTGMNLLGVSPLGAAHTLTYGADLIQYDTAFMHDGVTQSQENAKNIALFVEDRVELGKLAVIPGVRYNRFDLDSTVVSDTFSKVTAALAVEYQVSDQLVVNLSSTQLFKGPEISEVYTGAGLGETANPDLKAEGGVNTELSLAFEDEVLGADVFSAGVTVFKTKITHYIYDYATPPADVGGRAWKDNVGDMSVEGFEAYLGYDLGPLTTLLAFSKAESELDANADNAENDGMRQDRQRGNPLSINVDYDVASLNLLLHWDMQRLGRVDAGPALDSASLDNAKKGYTVHNVSARWTPDSLETLTLTFGVDNLFDEFYASQSSRTGTSFHPRFGELYLLDYEPGRNVKLTAAYQF